jgi:hypothetical protein
MSRPPWNFGGGSAILTRSHGIGRQALIELPPADCDESHPIPDLAQELNLRIGHRLVDGRHAFGQRIRIPLTIC